jgi:hypothetical protein
MSKELMQLTDLTLRKEVTIMSFVKQFELKLYVPATWEVAGHMADLWEKRLIESGELIKDKLNERMPDDGTFIREMVEPSSNGYGPYINPGFVSKGERSADNIRSTRQSNLVQAFTKWRENMLKAFATVDGVPAKAFKEKVAAAKDRWATKMAQGALRFTGDKIRGRSVAPIAAYYLVGDGRATAWIGPGDFSDGSAYNIARDRERAALKAAILQRLVQGGLMVVNSGYSITEILAQNTVNAGLLSGFSDPVKADAFVPTPAVDKCYCSWEVDTEGRLILHTQVGLTTP